MTNKKYVDSRFNEIEKRSILQKGDVLSNIVGASIGRTAIYTLDEVANINQAVCLIRVKPEKLDNRFLMFLLNSDFLIDVLLDNKLDNARANLSLAFFGGLELPLPPLAVQQKIVAEIERERAMVESARGLAAAMEGKIKMLIGGLWEKAV